jgi:hypothetical protein
VGSPRFRIGGIFAFTSPPANRTEGPVARVLQPIEIAGVKYRVLHLNGSRGPRYLLRSESGELLGLYPYGAEPRRFYAAPLKPARDTANPFARFDFFDAGGKLSIADGQKGVR